MHCVGGCGCVLLISAVLPVLRVTTQLHHCLGHFLCEGNPAQEAGGQPPETEAAASKVHTHSHKAERGSMKGDS